MTKGNEMTDRELLENAAKAAGLRIVDKSPPVSLYIESEGCKGGSFWNPLSDDGDALRLAVKLGFRVYIYPGAGDDFTVVGGDELSNRVSVRERHNGDPCAATRRAIVRAAAEIGKATA